MRLRPAVSATCRGQYTVVSSGRTVNRGRQTRPDQDLHGERRAVLPPGFGVGDDRELRVSKVDRERVLCVVRVA